MNALLLKSSLVVFCIHYVVLIDIPMIYYIGLWTSLLNHGFTYENLKRLDRICMIICFIYNLILMITFWLSFEFCLMALATMLYFLNTKKRHATAHIVITICNISLTLKISSSPISPRDAIIIFLN